MGQGDSGGAGVVACPHCGEAIEALGVDGGAGADPDEIIDDSRPASYLEDEMDGLRIRQIAVERRAAYRTRSYFIVGAVACAVVAGRLMTWAIEMIREGGQVWVLALVIIAVAGAVMGVVFFWRRAQAALREANHSALREPEHPPDLSSLSDGSQHWKNLDEVKDE